MLSDEVQEIVGSPNSSSGCSAGSPSDELRRWFAHDPRKWERFKAKYKKELNAKNGLIDELRSLSKKGTLILVYSAKDELHNQAVVLKEILENLDT